MRKRTVVILALFILMLAAAMGAYAAVGLHYRTHFFEHTTINGVDVSDLTIEEAERLIAEQAEDYRVTITTKEGTQEVIEGADIGYSFVSQGEVRAFLRKQNILAWLPAYLGRGSQYTMEASVTYDEAKLTAAVSGLACMQADQITQPQDAYLRQMEAGTYGIEPEVEGNQLDAEKTEELLRQAVRNGSDAVDLAAGDCYLEPVVYASDEMLQAQAELRNRYGAITVTYEMGGAIIEVLDEDTIAAWFSLDEDRQPVFDREAVAVWVAQLADKYDTVGVSQPFITSNGETIHVESHTYGWRLDQSAETEELCQLLLNGKSVKRRPVWLKEAWDRGENDIGNTYIEIDYTNQRMWYYRDGVLLVETPVVTGNINADMASPEGVFYLSEKAENEVLTGDGYVVPVNYWMPFCDDIGICDADSWREAYGGDIYMWSGSHGSINTPTASAQIIFQKSEVGTPVVCYSGSTNYGYAQRGVSADAEYGNPVMGSGDSAVGSGSSTVNNGYADIVTFRRESETSDDGSQADTAAEIGIEDWADDSVYYNEDGIPEIAIDVGGQ